MSIILHGHVTRLRAPPPPPSPPTCLSLFRGITVILQLFQLQCALIKSPIASSYWPTLAVNVPLASCLMQHRDISLALELPLPLPWSVAYLTLAGARCCSLPLKSSSQLPIRTQGTSHSSPVLQKGEGKDRVGPRA